MAEDIRQIPEYNDLYERQKETTEQVFADAKEKHTMRYTHYRGLTQVTNWLRLKFIAVNLKKYAIHRWKREHLSYCFNQVLLFCIFQKINPESRLKFRVIRHSDLGCKNIEKNMLFVNYNHIRPTLLH